MKHYVIYIPGLGDHRSYGQNIALQLWRLFGVRPTYLALGWQTKQSFDTKLSRIRRTVDALAADSNARISLVGVSAGASAAVNYFASDSRIHSVVLVCGKVNFPENVHPERYRINPDFEASMRRSSSAVKSLAADGRSKRILLIYSDQDKLVPPKDSFIEGARHKRIWSFGHVSVIALTLLLLGPTIARFIRTRS